MRMTFQRKERRRGGGVPSFPERYKERLKGRGGKGGINFEKSKNSENHFHVCGTKQVRRSQVSIQ